VTLKKLAVFCGSSAPKNDHFFNEIQLFLNSLFSINNYEIIYGGANIGVMGAVADIALKNGLLVYGVMPEFLQQREVDHKGLSGFELCETMHERKEKMYLLSDAFLILPGGFGTLDEFFEILTWRQLSLHQKPIYLLNIDGFYDGVISHIQSMERMGFISSSDTSLVKIVSKAEDLA